MDPINLICLHCQHYEKPNGFGCRAFPRGIPYNYPPDNRHSMPLEGQEGDFVFVLLDYKKLRGEELYNYFTVDHLDKDYASIVALLPIATGGDPDKAYKLLERSIQESRQIFAFYPAFDRTDTSKMEFIGEITDGALFLS